MKKNADYLDSPTEKWLIDVPYDTRQYGIRSAVSNIKSCISNKKNGNIANFNIGYKSKKDNKQMCIFDKRTLNIKKLTMFPRNKQKLRFRFRNKMLKWWKKNITQIDSNYTIIKENPNKYYLCLLVSKKNEQSFPLFNDVTLDPGKRTFNTFYSSDGICGKLGHNVDGVIKKIYKKIDKYTSLKENENKNKNKKTKRNLNNRCLKLRTKIKNIVGDLRRKTASFLCNNFKNIIIPKFGKDILKNNKKINRKTKRILSALSHGAFLETLKYKAKLNGNKLIICTEEFTSKTCGKCGTLNEKLNGKKIFSCSKCGYIEDRDINGARNILLKTLGKMQK